MVSSTAAFLIMGMIVWGVVAIILRMHPRGG